jgi:hypothetical protein
MRKVFFLFLGLFSLTMLKVSAQVRIGGIKDPHPAAILDLNASDTTKSGNRGLALPRLHLTSTTAYLNGTAPLDGMMVYNTNTRLGEGIYYCSSGKWIKVSSNAFIEGDAIVGNEVTNATPDRGLERKGFGTAKEPYTLGIADKGVTNSMIAPEAVTGDKIHAMRASQNDLLYYNGVQWAPVPVDTLMQQAGSGSGPNPASGIKSMQFKSGYNKSTKSFWITLDKAVNKDKTLFVLNGHRSRTNMPLRIMEVRDTGVFVEAGGTDVGTYFSLQALEMY